MRATLPSAALTAALLAAAAPPTLAAQITQTLPAVQTLGDFTPFDISGAPFDPTLGTLTDVTGELTGTVTASTFISLAPFPTTRQTTTYFVITPSGADPGPDSFHGALADQTVTPTVTASGGLYTGAPTAVDLTFDFGDVSQFVGPPSPSALLVEFGFRAGLPDRTGPTGGASDHTTFNGNLLLTYTYAAAGGAPVPEPASLALLGAGVLGLGVARRRHRREAA